VNATQNTPRLQLNQVSPNAGLGGVELLTKLLKIHKLFFAEKLLDFEDALGLPHCVDHITEKGYYFEVL
jgi:hypothetical protein